MVMRASSGVREARIVAWRWHIRQRRTLQTRNFFSETGYFGAVVGMFVQRRLGLKKRGDLRNWMVQVAVRVHRALLLFPDTLPRCVRADEGDGDVAVLRDGNVVMERGRWTYHGGRY
jgi:hypothetical protein